MEESTGTASLLRSVAQAQSTPTAPIVPNPKKRKLEEKEEAFFALALELGYSCTATRKLMLNLGESIARRMVHRSGPFLYQAMTFHIPNFDLLTAQKLFPEDNLQENTRANVSTWKMETIQDMMRSCSELMCLSGNDCAGLTRALKEPQERVCRVVAMIIPTVEISHVAFPRGIDRLYFNAEYILADEMGELHAPKDHAKREKEILNEPELRRKLLQDLAALFEKGVSLSPGFLRQLGHTAKADEVEAILLNQSKAENAGMPSRQALQERDMFEVESIMKERTVKGQSQFLVRWVGYHPMWEQWRMEGRGQAGDPLDTWEPLDNVVDTEALATWRGVLSLCTDSAGAAPRGLASCVVRSDT